MGSRTLDEDDADASRGPGRRNDRLLQLVLELRDEFDEYFAEQRAMIAEIRAEIVGIREDLAAFRQRSEE